MLFIYSYVFIVLTRFGNEVLILMFDRSRLNYLQKIWISIDKKLFFIFLIYILFGSLFIFTTSIPVAERINVDTYFFLKKQVIYIVIAFFVGALIVIAGDFLNIKVICLCFFFCLLMLILVKLSGFSTKGAKRWLYVFGFSIQPSEIIKPFLIMIISYILSITRKMPDIVKIIFSFLPLLIVSIFLYMQPDIGILMLLLSVYLSIIFLSDIKISNLFIIGIIFCFIFGLCYLSLPHVKNRVDTYILSLKNSKNVSYQVSTGLEAYKNSGYFGTGLLNGEIKKIIPDTHTDFIFPSITEEFGFIFSFIILLIYMYITIRICILAYKNKSNTYVFLSLNGLSLLIIYQVFINIGVTLNILPTKGMTLPFFSYGGSSIIGITITCALILNLTKKNYDYIEDGTINFFY